jgi:hypothetical protein
MTVGTRTEGNTPEDQTMLSTTSHKQSGIGQVISQIVVKAVCFVAAECLLNAAGVDTIADYYEFIAGQAEVEIAAHQFFVPPIFPIDLPREIA